jgi:hypothetical protein
VYLPCLLASEDSAEYERTLDNIHTQLDEATIASAWAEGQALTLAQAIAAALNR